MPYKECKATLTDIGSEAAKCSSLPPFYAQGRAQKMVARAARAPCGEQGAINLPCSMFNRGFAVALLTYKTTCKGADLSKLQYAPCCGQQSSPQCSGKRYRPAFLPKPGRGS